MSESSGRLVRGRSDRRPRVRWWLAAGALVLAGAIVANETVETLSYSDEKLAIDGVANLGRVNPRLYRGGQPSEAGFVSLKRLGVDQIVSFTIGDQSIADESRRVRALGMSYLSLPWSATREPTADQVATFLALFRQYPGRTIFVHCWQGADRTGVMVALYRITFDHWSAAHALDEMKAFHYHVLFHPHLQRYVERFAADPLALGRPSLRGPG